MPKELVPEQMDEATTAFPHLEAASYPPHRQTSSMKCSRLKTESVNESAGGLATLWLAWLLACFLAPGCPRTGLSDAFLFGAIQNFTTAA